MKNINYFSMLACVIISFALINGCASSSALKKFPKRQIDRPYSLPEGVSAWKTFAVGSIIKSDQTTRYQIPIPIPLVWEDSFSDDFDLIWAPIPLGFRFQLSKTNTVLSGASFVPGFGYDSKKGLSINPGITSLFRMYVDNYWALDSHINFSGTYFPSENEKEWTVGIKVGPLFQIQNNFAIKPTLTGAIHNSDDSKSVNVTAPIGLWTSWLFHRQWELESTYNLSIIGYKNGHSRHQLRMTLIHYW
jgi:hypothetical protein